MWKKKLYPCILIPPSMEESSDEIIPEEVSLFSQFLLPNLDDSSDNEDTKVTELITEAEINNTISEEEMPSVNSEATSLVNTNEFLEFMDTIDMGESERTNQSELVETRSVWCCRRIKSHRTDFR